MLSYLVWYGSYYGYFLVVPECLGQSRIFTILPIFTIIIHVPNWKKRLVWDRKKKKISMLGSNPQPSLQRHECHY